MDEPFLKQIRNIQFYGSIQIFLFCWLWILDRISCLLWFIKSMCLGKPLSSNIFVKDHRKLFWRTKELEMLRIYVFYPKKTQYLAIKACVTRGSEYKPFVVAAAAVAGIITFGEMISLSGIWILIHIHCRIKF